MDECKILASADVRRRGKAPGETWVADNPAKLQRENIGAKQDRYLRLCPEGSITTNGISKLTYERGKDMEREKYVDESWKETAEKEKEILSSAVKGQSAQKEPLYVEEPARSEHQDHLQERSESPSSSGSEELTIDFMNYIASLGYQAMIFLGEMPHPATNQIEKNLQQAKFLIDTMVMLRDKTKGNLSKQENDMLNTSIYELQMRFVEISSKEASQTA